MAWRYRLDGLLRDLNRVRARDGRAELSWSQLAPLLGISRQALQNLASNRGTKTTNTRFLETLCRFFGKSIEDVIELAPPMGRTGVDQNEVDRLVLFGHELPANQRPAYHVELL